ncbi:hypothetical protein SEUCBS139899_008806 [Sporothrix eucalyptigena]|uniref:Uncharacterized protein n=1 Tax=Sporothrix eucalyptigena TaxID=1812306 RepID=A0ABP0APR6_9PEZI
MARSKGKKGGFIAWPWVGADESSQNDEAKLPPLEAFSYKGFMADLQNTTDIRSDLDRIAEICARSRYCLSDKYDSHVTPHGSGANFAASVRQHPSWSKGRRKGSSSPGGPTLQAVPSDDDESSARGSRRRRGGMGGARRRSAAYGTLETIMSSSRSSEEDKTKKKSAADIKEAVRGRAARKGMVAPEDPTAASEETSGQDQTSGSSSSPSGKDKGKRGSCFSEDIPSPDRVDGDSVLPEARTSGPPLRSRSSPDQHNEKRVPRRPKSTAFAQAMIGSSNRQHKQRQAATTSENGSSSAPHATINFSAVPALLSDPALPQTTIDYRYRHSRRGAREPGVHIVDLDSDALQDPSLYPDPGDAAASAGLFSGFTTWIPWMATGSNDHTAEHPWANGHTRPRGHVASAPSAAASPVVAGPSHAEGSLRELLKSVDDGNSKQKKGKAVDDSGSL